MKISESELNSLNEQETLDWLYSIPATRVPGTNYEFYNSIVKARCVKVVSEQPPWYLDRYTRNFCEGCYLEISADDQEDIGIQILDKHRLMPGPYHTAHCTICGLELLRTQTPYKCDDCILAWILNRVDIENGHAVVINWESKN